MGHICGIGVRFNFICHEMFGGVSDEPASALCRLPRPVLTDGHFGRSTAQSGFLTADYAAALTSIFFSGFCAAGFFGSVTASTSFLKLASILSASAPRIGCCL